MKLLSKISLIAVILLAGAPELTAQQVTVDKVIANVGNNPILLSELEIRFKEEKLYLNPDAEKAKCDLLYRIIQEKLMIVQAGRDSVVVSSEEVESQLDQRIGYFSMQLGGDSKLEEYFGKPMVEIKADLRNNLKDQLIVQKMRGQLLSNIQVTPSEVRKNYRAIPKDSLPYYNTEVEIGQIVVFPKVNDKQKEKTRKRVLGIRKQILEGEITFEDAALIYSDDPGSQVQGGDLGMVNRNDFVAEFSSAAIRLKRDSISGVVETQFGLHLIKLVERRGDMIHCKHILFKPRITNKDEEQAQLELDTIRNKILKDTMTFEAASFLYSEDDESKNNGGMLFDQNSGSIRIPIENLDEATYDKIIKMNVGDISTPMMFMTRDGRKGYKILLLKSKIKPHVANLEQDYPRLSDIAKQKKTSQVLNTWTHKIIPSVYFRVDEKYTNCNEISRLINTIEKYN